MSATAAIIEFGFYDGPNGSSGRVVAGAGVFEFQNEPEVNNIPSNSDERITGERTVPV